MSKSKSSEETESVVMVIFVNWTQPDASREENVNRVSIIRPDVTVCVCVCILRMVTEVGGPVYYGDTNP